jgi:polyisoprenoid-binding protein YceI
MSKTRFAVLAVALALAARLDAADTYQFDKAHTNVGFQVRHIFTNVSGKFTDFAGTIQVDRAKPENSTVEFTIQSTSIDTSEPRRDTHLRSADFFDVANNPTISFKSTSLKANGKDSWLVTGDLTMHGVTKEVVLDVTGVKEIKDPWGNTRMGAVATTKVDRKDYGLLWNKSLEAGGVLVGDDVAITLDIELVKKAAEAPKQ